MVSIRRKIPENLAKVTGDGKGGLLWPEDTEARIRMLRHGVDFST